MGTQTLSTDSRPCPKFTPGPWEALLTDSEAHAVVSPGFDAGDPWFTAIVQCADEQTEDANARLIAAAPELYEALDPTNVRAAAKLLTAAGHGLHAGLLILMADAQDRALAKARGDTEVINRRRRA